MDVKFLGMYFNEYTIDEDELPSKDLTIKRDDLDRSSKNILGRFAYEIESRTKLVFTVLVDGRKVDNFGTNLPYFTTSGEYTTVLFRYPNSARAMKPGVHKITVKYGLIDRLVESSTNVIWDEVKGIGEETVLIRLLPNEVE